MPHKINFDFAQIPPGTNLKLSEIGMLSSTIEDIDASILDWLKEDLELSATTNEGWKAVPIFWQTPERAFQIKSEKSLRDSSGALVLPVVSVERTGITKDPTRKGGFQAHYYSNDSTGNIGRREVLRRVKKDKTSALSNALSQKRGGTQKVASDPYNRRATKEVIYEIFTAPIPVYVNIDYKITLMTEYIQQMNSLVQPFMTRTGQINSFIMRRNGHLYEAFIDQNFTQENNVSNLAEEERKFKTEITIKVIAPLVGEGENDNKNLIEKKESVSRYYFPSESTIYQ